MRRFVPALLFLVAGIASATPPPAAQHEIAQLFDALSQSGCRFNRNGSWYDAAAAREHLQRKYEYLLRRDAVPSAERFIELAASKSSMSGRAYLVQCPGAAAVDSGAWFRRALMQSRAHPSRP